MNYDEGGSGAIDLTVASPEQRVEHQVQVLRADNQAASGAVPRRINSQANDIG